MQELSFQNPSLDGYLESILVLFRFKLGFCTAFCERTSLPTCLSMQSNLQPQSAQADYGMTPLYKDFYIIIVCENQCHLRHPWSIVAIKKELCDCSHNSFNKNMSKIYFKIPKNVVEYFARSESGVK